MKNEQVENNVKSLVTSERYLTLESNSVDWN